MTDDEIERIASEVAADPEAGRRLEERLDREALARELSELLDAVLSGDSQQSSFWSLMVECRLSDMNPATARAVIDTVGSVLLQSLAWVAESKFDRMLRDAWLAQPFQEAVL